MADIQTMAPPQTRGLHWPGSQLQHNGKISLRSGVSRPDIPDYTKVDLALRYAPPIQGLEIALIASNIFDKGIYEPSDGRITDDFPMEGCSTMLELGYQF